MRSAIRIGAAKARIPSHVASRPGFVCLQCQQRASEAGRWPQSAALTTYTAKRNASSKFTEGLRKRIWGTSDSPGQEDPYGDKSLLDRSKEKGAKSEAAEAEPEEVTLDTKAQTSVPRGRDLGPDYEPATSLADLALLPPTHRVPLFHGLVLLNFYYPTFTET